MKKINLTTFLAISLTMSLHAETGYISIVGGGGEPENAETTQFDTGIANLSHFYNTYRGIYKTTINFNGGHKGTEAMIVDKFPGADIKNGFNKESLESVVAGYIKKLTANPPEIKPGEKIILFISDHGGESSGSTHKISSSNSALTNFNTGNKDGMIGLDFLSTLSDAAKKANVKLAIIDATCHSGNSLSLANEKTCVISASGPKHYGYTSFAETFANNMERGLNLEDVFLLTREKVNGNGFPEISTPEGVAVQDSLYPLLTPFMYYHDEYRGMALDKIDNYFKENAINGTAGFCSRQNQYMQLSAFLTLIEDVNTIEKKSWFSKNITKEKTVDLTELRKKISEYRNVQEEYIKRLQEISMPDLDRREPMETPEGKTPGYTHKELIDGDWDYYIAEKVKDLQDISIGAEKRQSLLNSVEYYKTCKETKKRVLEQHPEYVKYKGILDELKTDTKVSRDVGSGIAEEASKAYAAYYKNQQKKRTDTDKKATNACKDFVL